MKTKEQIERLAFEKSNEEKLLTEAGQLCFEVGYIKGFQDCQEMDNWISVENELPPINIPVLCYQKSKYCQFRTMVLGFDGKAFKDFYNGSDDDILFMDGNYPKISHWQPLPASPKEKKCTVK